MTRCHPGFHRSPSIQWDWPDSGSNRLSSIRLFATRRMVVAGGLEPPVFLCRRVTVCCRRRWATPPVHRFCPSRCDAYRAPVHLYPQAHGRWIGVVELPGIEPGSGLPSAIACRHVRIRRLTLIRGRVRSANPHGL